MTSQLDNPSQWATGNDAPTEKQKAFLSTLAADKDAQVDPARMNKSEASSKIDELKNAESTNPGAAAGEPIQHPDSWTTGGGSGYGEADGVYCGYGARGGREGGDGWHGED